MRRKTIAMVASMTMKAMRAFFFVNTQTRTMRWETIAHCNQKNFCILWLLKRFYFGHLCCMPVCLWLEKHHSHINEFLTAFLVCAETYIGMHFLVLWTNVLANCHNTSKRNVNLKTNSLVSSSDPISSNPISSKQITTCPILSNFECDNSK